MQTETTTLAVKTGDLVELTLPWDNRRPRGHLIGLADEQTGGAACWLVMPLVTPEGVAAGALGGQVVHWSRDHFRLAEGPALAVTMTGGEATQLYRFLQDMGASAATMIKVFDRVEWLLANDWRKRAAFLALRALHRWDR